MCFTTEEEVGFLGVDAAADNLDFFYDVSYFIQADRHGSSDLITYTNGIYSASDEWLQEITPIMAKYKYSEEYGIGTDVGVLSERLQLSGVNVSCGYYREHTDDEYTIISELQNCLNFIEEIIKSVPTNKQYEIIVDYKPYTKYHDIMSYEPNYSFNDYPSDNDYYIPCEHCKDFDCMNCPHDAWWNEQNR
jgi:putative aminopeptidase FrvX